MKYLIIILICLFIISIISMIYSYFKIDISSYIIKNDKIDKNLKIIFLSDLHNRKIVNKLKNIIDKELPDLIILGGDMVNEYKNESGNFIELINNIKNYKMYYVFGNHEEKMEVDLKIDYNKKLNLTNIIVLNNDNVKLSNNINLIGFNSEIDYYKIKDKKIFNKDVIISKIGNINKDNYNILIAHNPLEFDSYVDYGCDLVLSGHVHGGVIKIPFVGALLSPDYSFFPKYYDGKVVKDNTTMIVSRGIGFSKRIPFRINNPGEVVIINLVCEDK